MSIGLRGASKWLAALVVAAATAACAADGEVGDGSGAGLNDRVDALGGHVDLTRKDPTDPAEARAGDPFDLALSTESATVVLAPFQRLELYSGVAGEGARILELPLGLTTDAVRLAAGDTLDPSLAELGNLLFFDQRLSAGAKIACATCHVPSDGFSSKQINVGVLGTPMPRTTPAAVNRAFGTENNWLGQRTLEAQSTAPITTATEMGLTEAQLVAVVSGIPGYSERFTHLVQAGILANPAVSVANIQRAIATFQRTLMTGSSRVDQYEAGLTSALTPTEIAGRTLFHGKARCFLCHSGPNYTDEGYHNIETGCPAGGGACTHPTTTFEPGRYLVTGNVADIGKFKTPSLRNVGLRGPYFHHGHDPTLAVVVHGYNVSANLDAEIGQDPLLVPLGLSPTEEAQLVSFLMALSGTIEVSAAMSAPATATTSSYRERYLLSPAVFDVAFYRSRNTDVPNLTTMTDDQVRDHWLSTGAAQGRRGTGTFQPVEYDLLMANAAGSGWTRASVLGTYVPAIQNYLDRGRRLHPLWGRYMTHPGFFEYRQYREMNAARLGMTPYTGVIQDFLSYGIGNELAGRKQYIDGTGFRILDVAGKDYFIKSGTYCESPHVAGSPLLPVWPYVPPNLPSAGACG